MKNLPSKSIIERLAVLFLTSVLGFLVVATAAAKTREPVLENLYERWLSSVSPWMLPSERQTFVTLTSDVEREIFMRRFWEARGESGGYGPLARWHQNFEEASERFDDLSHDRAQTLIMAGKPAEIMVFAGCRNVIRPLRIWTFSSGNASSTEEADRQGFHIVFYRASHADGEYRIWSPDDGPKALLFDGPSRYRDWPLDEVISYASLKDCFRWSPPADVSTFAIALRSALGPDDLLRLTAPPEPAPDWLERLRAELAISEPRLAGEPLSVSYLGRYQTRTILHGRVTLPVTHVSRNADGQLFDRVVISGDIRRGERLVDAFRVVHLIAGTAAGKKHVTLDFYRRLHPTSYQLDLRVEDAHGLGLMREKIPLDVPRLEDEATPPPGHRLGFPGLTRSQVGMLTTFPSIEILPPEDDILIGDLEVVAATTGGPIARVELRLDGQPVANDDAPPYAATVSLAETPQRHHLEAIAYDSEDRAMARHAIVLNDGPARFAVRLLEPVFGSRSEQAKVEVDVPRDATLDRVELYLGDELVATAGETQLEHPLPEAHVPYVRAVAYLTDGESHEDLVFLDTRTPLEQIDVQLVELYTSVLDAQGRFVRGLTAEDFHVLEDGVPQTLRRFDTVENLAINVAVLMDVSMSMRKKIQVATRSARRFFDTVLTAKDQASFLTFNHDIRRIVPFTHDAGDLRNGVDGFRAWGTTRLHDSVVYSVHSFGGLAGKRALILLSDGQDIDSDFHFRQVLEETLRSGVAVYPIVLGIEDAQTLENLRRLAAESGGRFFRILGVGHLDRIYRMIEEELRSQYLLVYEPPTGARHDFRRVEVEVLPPGLRARSIRGYYP